MAKKEDAVSDAKKVIEQEMKDRAENAKKELDALCKKYNVQLVPMVSIGQQALHTNQVLVLPVAIHIIPNQ